MHKLIPSVKEENGCLWYEVYSNPYEQTEIFFYEEWENKSALDEHLTQPKMVKHFEEVQSWFEDKLLITEDLTKRKWTIADNGVHY